MKYLILGGSGFIGGNLARALVKNGICPRIYTRSSASITNIADILNCVEVVYGDFLDDVALRKALNGIDVVYHLISTTFPGTVVESSVYDISSNLIPTIRLLEIAKNFNIKKIIYGSSGGTIYGEPCEIPIKENHPLKPISLYGQSKLMIENYLTFYSRLFDITTQILRISNPFGPGQRVFGVQGIIGVAMGCAYYDRTLQIYGRGETIRDYIYIDDLITALLQASQIPESKVLNISSGIGRSVMDVVLAIEKTSGKEIDKIFIPSRTSDVNVNILSNSLAYQEYSWKPEITFEEGILRTWNYLHEHELVRFSST